MLIDKIMTFGLPAISGVNTVTICTDVFDGLSAIKLFAADDLPLLRCYTTGLTAGTGTLSFRLHMVADSLANLTTTPIILADSGVLLNAEDGTALATGDDIQVAIAIQRQTATRRFYGAFVTLGGTNPSIAADAKQCFLSMTGQSHLPGLRAAIPA